ncbi:unnamed protein product [Rhizophagus irregularis]|nr:unnamed protein product [Rhizophagus irregularis]CAB5101031.1 unnamed protein product [Rhizophagus irregularis]
MLQVLQKSLPNLLINPDLSLKFAEILKGIKEYNDSLQNLETLSEIVEENLDKFTRANCSTRFLNSSIISEVESTIEKLKDGETKRVKIRDNIHSALQDKLNNISYT